MGLEVFLGSSYHCCFEPGVHFCVVLPERDSGVCWSDVSKLIWISHPALIEIFSGFREEGKKTGNA